MVFMKLSALALSYGLPRADEAVDGQQVAIALRCILRAAVGMMPAARRRLSLLDCGFQGRHRQSGVDRATDRTADDAARPGVEDHGDVDEADRDRDIGDVGDPQLVGSVDNDVCGPIGEDRLVVIAVGRCDIASADSRLQSVLAHEAFDLLVIDEHALLLQGRAHPPPRERAFDVLLR